MPGPGHARASQAWRAVGAEPRAELTRGRHDTLSRMRLDVACRLSGSSLQGRCADDAEDAHDTVSSLAECGGPGTRVNARAHRND